MDCHHHQESTRTQGFEKKHLLSQYDFRREIAMSWIDPVVYWPDRDCSPQKKRRASTSAVQATKKKARPPARAVKEKTKKKTRAPKMNEANLHPTTGALAGRLGTEVKHFLVTSTAKVPPKCALHRWATDGEVYRAHVFECDQCKVCLCIECFKLFHTEEDIVGMKWELKLKYASAARGKRCQANVNTSNL
jgi:hypothetical protein